MIQDYQLSANFMASEFACKCGCGFGMKPGDVDPRLVIGLQTIRRWLGVPLTVNSGCRCPAWNKKQGGVENSFHIQGIAADITGAPIEEIIHCAEQIPVFKNGGIGRYPKKNFVHLDVRGEKARWTK